MWDLTSESETSIGVQYQFRGHLFNGNQMSGNVGFAA